MLNGGLKAHEKTAWTLQFEMPLPCLPYGTTFGSQGKD